MLVPLAAHWSLGLIGDPESQCERERERERERESMAAARAGGGRLLRGEWKSCRVQGQLLSCAQALGVGFSRRPPAGYGSDYISSPLWPPKFVGRRSPRSSASVSAASQSRSRPNGGQRLPIKMVAARAKRDQLALVPISVQREEASQLSAIISKCWPNFLAGCTIGSSFCSGEER